MVLEKNVRVLEDTERRCSILKMTDSLGIVLGAGWFKDQNIPQPPRTRHMYENKDHVKNEHRKRYSKI